MTHPNGIRAIALALGALSGGCLGPLLSDTKKPAHSGAAKTKSSTPANRGTPTTGDVAPLSTLRVQSESVQASDIWLGHRQELLEKQQSVGSEAFRAFVSQRAAELITDKVAEMLLYQKAALRQPEDVGKRVDAYLDGEIRKIVTAQHGGMQRRYEKHLEAQGTTLERARDDLRRQFIIAGYLEMEVRAKVAEPTRADLVAAFEANRQAWRRPARRSMSLIDIRVSELLPREITEPTREQTQAARAEARSKAQAALAEIRNSTPFAEVARRYSHDSRAAEGGVWGWINPDSVRERYKPALEALDKLGAARVSEVIETPDGFFIVRCDEFEPGVEPDFLSVQPQLREIAIRRTYNQRVTDLVAELRTQARIESIDLERFHAAVVAAALEPSVSK